MNYFSKSLTVKLWVIVSVLIFITIIYSYFLSYMFYEKLYVDNVEQSLLEEGNRLSLDYEGGQITEDLRRKIEWYNSKSEANVFIVNNPRELSACLPFEIDYDTLISENDREQLLDGKPINKLGYEERFERQIMAVIIPLLDGDYLEGIIYLYIPLTTIDEFTQEFATFLFIGAVLFFIVALFFGTKWINRLTQPLREMKSAAVRVSEGDFSARVHIQSKDEVGELATAFNQMSESIQKADERKKEFIGDISHELRTPISYVKGYSDMLLSDMVKSEVDKQNYLQLIHRESEHIVRLVDDLLDLTKLESDEYELDKTPLPLAQLIEDALQKYCSTTAEKGITLTYDLDPELIINGDEGKVERIFQNVMDNAIRYTDHGGEITIKLIKQRDYCQLTISDTGIGISKEDLLKITERFYRVNKGRSRADGGTGLGLSIVDKLVKLHGGQLKIKSELGKGTEISVIFPIIKD